MVRVLVEGLLGADCFGFGFGNFEWPCFSGHWTFLGLELCMVPVAHFLWHVSV